MRSEALQTPFGSLDKLTGQLFLAQHGFSVPQIFRDWSEAQRWINAGGKVLARGRFIGEPDNILIDSLPTKNIYSEKGWISFLEERKKRPYNYEYFEDYCKANGINPQELKVDFFLQKEIPCDFRIITMDNGPHEVLVQAAHVPEHKGGDTFGQRFDTSSPLEKQVETNIYKSLLLSALKLHQDAAALLNRQGPRFGYQMELISDKNNSKLNVVQTRIVAPYPHEGIIFYNEQTADKIRQKIASAKEGSVIYMDDINDHSFGKIADKNNIVLIYKVSTERHDSFLKHQSYFLFKFVWRKGGSVIITMEDLDDLEGLQESQDFEDF
jgi:hypothetical protein